METKEKTEIVQVKKNEEEMEINLALSILVTQLSQLIIFAIIGARLYYVAFSWDAYKNN